MKPVRSSVSLWILMADEQPQPLRPQGESRVSGRLKLLIMVLRQFFYQPQRCIRGSHLPNIRGATGNHLPVFGGPRETSLGRAVAEASLGGSSITHEEECTSIFGTSFSPFVQVSHLQEYVQRYPSS